MAVVDFLSAIRCIDRTHFEKSVLCNYLEIWEQNLGKLR